MPPPSPSSVRRRALLLAAGAAGSLASPWPLRAATLPRVLLFSPNSEGNTYWPQVFEILSNVAQALQFDFVPFSFGVGDRFVRQAEALRLIGQAPRPQAVIADVVIGDAARELEAAEQAGVPLFLLGPLFPAELPALGGAPRLKYRRWAALLQSDEEEKGYRLGGLLLDAARQAQAFARDGRVHAVGLGGARSWSGSQLREAGFARAVTERPFALLHQVVPTRWSPAEGRHITTRLLQRYPESSVVWAASDQLGAGAAQAPCRRPAARSGATPSPAGSICRSSGSRWCSRAASSPPSRRRSRRGSNSRCWSTTMCAASTSPTSWAAP